MACVYAILVSWLIYREATLKEVFQSASRSMFLTGQVFIILACAGLVPFIIAAIGALLVVTFVPQLSLFILRFL